jgi:hypothetical protein
MRRLWAILATLMLAQCVTPGDDRFQAGAESDALVIIGVAKAPRDTSPRYTMLWRLLNEDGEFSSLTDEASFDAETNSGDTERVRGIPGEFEIERVEPGVYALDSVFAVIRDRNVDYVAQGVVTGPERPSFEVRAGEAVYLGIWEMNIVDSTAVTRLWRLSGSDARAVERGAEAVAGEIRVRETQSRAVPCSPHRASNLTTRQVC